MLSFSHVFPVISAFLVYEEKYTNIIASRGDNGQVLSPEIEEYFLYTPSPNYPTSIMTGGGGAKGAAGTAKIFNAKP